VPLTLDEAKNKLPKLFTLPKVVVFSSQRVAEIAKLKPTGASDCFEISIKPN